MMEKNKFQGTQFVIPQVVSGEPSFKSTTLESRLKDVGHDTVGFSIKAFGTYGKERRHFLNDQRHLCGLCVQTRR